MSSFFKKISLAIAILLVPVVGTANAAPYETRRGYDVTTDRRQPAQRPAFEREELMGESMRRLEQSQAFEGLPSAPRSGKWMRWEGNKNNG